MEHLKQNGTEYFIQILFLIQIQRVLEIHGTW